MTDTEKYNQRLKVLPKVAHALTRVLSGHPRFSTLSGQESPQYDEEFKRLLAMAIRDPEAALFKKAGPWIDFTQYSQEIRKCPVDGEELGVVDLYLEFYGESVPGLSAEEILKAKELARTYEGRIRGGLGGSVSGPVPFQCPNRHTLSFDGATITERPESLEDKILAYVIEDLGRPPGLWANQLAPEVTEAPGT